MGGGGVVFIYFLTHLHDSGAHAPRARCLSCLKFPAGTIPLPRADLKQMLTQFKLFFLVKQNGLQGASAGLMVSAQRGGEVDGCHRMMIRTHIVSSG